MVTPREAYTNSVQREARTGARLRAADFGAGGEMIGRAVQGFGQDLSKVAEQFEQIGDARDQGAVKEAANAIAKHYAEVGFTSEGAYFNSSGKAALMGRPNIEKSIDDLITQTRNGLKRGRQQDLFDQTMTPQRTAWGVQIAKHEDKETLTYDITESEARRSNVAELAKLVYLTDPKDGERQIGTGLGEIQALANRLDWGPEKTTAEKLKYTDSIYRDIGSRIAFADPVNGPALAIEFVKQHKASMTSDSRETVLTRARVAQNAYDADQRQQQAEVARAAREAQQDARDKAKGFADNIDLGIPLSKEDAAIAISTARASGDVALIKRIQTGMFKNALTVEYAGSAPSALQGRVNVLSAEIVQAGDKVKPETVIERDHLQALLRRTNAAIGSDAISWGAGALGMDPGQIDLRNPATIAHRLSFAQAVSRRTGMPPAQVLTNEEAATLSPGVVNGTVAQKTKMAVSLAQFGPLAGVAARQVAPNNAGFQNLVGLAGLPNRGVAMSRVNQVVAGQEILKTNAKMVKKDDAQREFQTMTAGALQFLPSVKAGVFDNATAILANEANERGVTEWGEARPRWFAAVNSALGAYTKDGKQIGGLSAFNGGMTVVPTDMAVDDFERRVSRAGGAQFRGASNGLPVYANGKEPTVNDIRKMQWVPIGDGIYRVGTGSEFLRLKDGNFFVVNARKLP